MYARVMNAKTLLAATAVFALLLLVGAGIAYATGSDDDASERSTGPGMDKARSVALDHVNGRVTGTEFRDEEGYYEVEVTRDDGSQVDVHLDKNFHVLDTPADGEDQEDNGSPDDGG